MSVRDFGHFDAPLVLFGGVYSKTRALEALATVLRGASEVSTGGQVGCAAEPVQTVALFHDLGWTGIAGTCDRDSAEEAAERNFGGAGGSPREILSRGRYPYALAANGAEDRIRMARLPEIGSFVQRGRRPAVAHGGAKIPPPDLPC